MFESQASHVLYMAYSTIPFLGTLNLVSRSLKEEIMRKIQICEKRMDERKLIKKRINTAISGKNLGQIGSVIKFRTGKII
jgi:hypothetical protein